MLRHRHELPVEGELPGWSIRLAEPRTGDARQSPRARRARQLRHVHLHQLDPLRCPGPGMGDQVRRSRARSIECSRRLSSSSRVPRRATPCTTPSRRWRSVIRCVVDNDYAVWQAFDNHYWPTLYFVDADGRIRHHHFGEGEYGNSRWSSRCCCGRRVPTWNRASCGSSPTVSRRRPTGPLWDGRRATSAPARRQLLTGGFV